MTERDQIQYQDVPDHEANLTSSVGGLWPPERASFGRIKGIYTNGIVATEAEVTAIVDELNSHGFKHFTDDQSGITRISLRAVINTHVLQSIAERYRPFIEVVIPLYGTQEVFTDTAMVYFGLNHESRQSLPEELDACGNNLTDALTVSVRSPGEILNRVKSRGYEVEVVSLPKDEVEKNKIIDQVSVLYERFGWSRDEVISILTNPNNIVGVGLYEGTIISAGIAEMAIVPIGSDKLRIVEITEAATAQEHGRNGLYTAVSASLLLDLAEKSQQKNIHGGEVDFVFGECNGNAPGVLKTARIQGRIFAQEVGRLYNLPESGILHQHVPISGAPRKTPFNDLFPAFIVRQQLYKLYGGFHGD